MHSHPEAADTLIVGAQLYDGTGAPPVERDVALRNGRIAAIGNLTNWLSEEVVEANGRALAPGFIDVHTHDDLQVIHTPHMLPKITQGVTTVIVGNCGISASPVVLKGEPPDPMILLGERDAFQYPTFAAYVDAVNAARPAVNVGALIGHTALRNNQMDRLDRAASVDEIDGMRAQLKDALAHGALGLSTGLAYRSAFDAPTAEVMALTELLADAGALYTTHIRNEFDGVLDAMDEAYRIGRYARVPVVISHLKCAGPSNWGRSTEVLASLEGGAAIAAGRMRLLSVRPQFFDARRESGDGRNRHHDNVVEAASRDGRQAAQSGCRRLGRDGTGRGAASAAGGRGVSQHVGRRRTADSFASGDDGGVRRDTERSATAPPAMGHVSAGARTLRARCRIDPA